MDADSMTDDLIKRTRSPEWIAATAAYEKEPTLKNMLAMEAEWSGYLGYKLLAKHGIEMKALPKLPKGVRKRKLGMCFMNATELVMRRPDDFRYVEGYAHRATLPIKMEHAWAIDKDGMVVDPTWADTAEGNSYVGVIIPREIMDREMRRLKHYGVLFGVFGLNLNAVRTLWPDVLPEHLREERA